MSHPQDTVPALLSASGGGGYRGSVWGKHSAAIYPTFPSATSLCICCPDSFLRRMESVLIYKCLFEASIFFLLFGLKIKGGWCGVAFTVRTVSQSPGIWDPKGTGALLGISSTAGCVRTPLPCAEFLHGHSHSTFLWGRDSWLHLMAQCRFMLGSSLCQVL